MPVNTATWQFAVASLPSTSAAQAVVTMLEKPQAVDYTRRRSDYCEMTCVITDRGDTNALEAVAYRRSLVAWRNGVPRFNGQIVEYKDTPEGITFTAKDPFYGLVWRRIQSKESYSGLDAAEVAMRLVEQQNSYVTAALYPSARTTFLRRGNKAAVPLTVLLREFEAGDVIAEKIRYLTRVPDSFEFVVNPVIEANYMGKLDTYATYNTIRTAAPFHWGAGTFENCLDYEIEAMPLVTKANVVGKDGKVASAESVSGTTDFGRWEDERGQVNIAGDQVLLDIADGFVMDSVKYAVTLVPGPEAPQLFTDFDVLDMVPVYIRRPSRPINGPRAVISATLSLDPNSGAESLTELVLLDKDLSDA